MFNYLELLEKVLMDKVYISQETPPDMMPLRAYTGLSLERLRNISACCASIAYDDIVGAFVDCGVWRGGSSIMMAASSSLSTPWRDIYVCDSFEGLPRPSHEADVNLNLFLYKELAVCEEEVRANFERFGLMSEKVHFIKGWFKDTLPKLKETIGPIAMLRSDGDLYESTRNVLDNLYPLISSGGYYIEDDYYNINAVHRAVDDYRIEHGITEPIQRIDRSGCFWRVK